MTTNETRYPWAYGFLRSAVDGVWGTKPKPHNQPKDLTTT